MDSVYRMSTFVLISWNSTRQPLELSAYHYLTEMFLYMTNKIKWTPNPNFDGGLYDREKFQREVDPCENQVLHCPFYLLASYLKNTKEMTSVACSRLSLKES